MTPTEERRDEASRYHKMSLRNLTQLAPFIDWTDYVNRRYRDAGLTGNDDDGATSTGSDDDDGASSTGSDATSTGRTDALAPFDDSEPIIVYSPDYLRKVNALIEEYNSTDDGKIKLSNYMVSGLN